MNLALDLSVSSLVVPEIDTEVHDDNGVGPSGPRIRCHDAAGRQVKATFGRALFPCLEHLRYWRCLPGLFASVGMDAMFDVP